MPAPPDAPPRRSLRPALWSLHLYGGLVCCGYLLVYGVSSLAFNHPGLLPEPGAQRTSWQADVDVPALEDDLARAEAVRDALGLFGWPLPWAMEREADGTLRFEMERPGRRYWIRVDGEGRARVESQPKGLRSVLKGLHGLTGVPGSPLMSVWSVYTELTTWVVLFSVASSAYLWATRARNRRPVAWTSAAALALSVLLMLLVCRG